MQIWNKLQYTMLHLYYDGRWKTPHWKIGHHHWQFNSLIWLQTRHCIIMQCYNEHKASGKCRCVFDPLRTLFSLLAPLRMTFFLLTLLKTSLHLLAWQRTSLSHSAPPSRTLRDITPKGSGPPFALPSGSRTLEAVTFSCTSAITFHFLCCSGHQHVHCTVFAFLLVIPYLWAYLLLCFS